MGSPTVSRASSLRTDRRRRLKKLLKPRLRLTDQSQYRGISLRSQCRVSGASQGASPHKPKKKDKGKRMKPTDYTGRNTTQKPALAPESGEPSKARNNAHSSSSESGTGKQKRKPNASRLLTRDMACKRLGCHWQTLLYREKRGDFTGIKIGRCKYYVAAEIEQAHLTKPVHNKPNKAKRHVAVTETIQQPTKPTLWNRIIAFFVR